MSYLRNLRVCSVAVSPSHNPRIPTPPPNNPTRSSTMTNPSTAGFPLTGSFAPLNEPEEASLKELMENRNHPAFTLNDYDLMNHFRRRKGLPALPLPPHLIPPPPVEEEEMGEAVGTPKTTTGVAPTLPFTYDPNDETLTSMFRRGQVLLDRALAAGAMAKKISEAKAEDTFWTLNLKGVTLPEDQVKELQAHLRPQILDFLVNSKKAASQAAYEEFSGLQNLFRKELETRAAAMPELRPEFSAYVQRVIDRYVSELDSKLRDLATRVHLTPKVNDKKKLLKVPPAFKLNHFYPLGEEEDARQQRPSTEGPREEPQEEGPKAQKSRGRTRTRQRRGFWGKTKSICS